MDSVKEFLDNKYVVYRSAVDDQMVDFISQYALFDELQNPSIGDPQVAKAHSKYGDPAMETLLLMLQPLMERITGLELEPTYSYYRVYRNGDELSEHTDRPSCEISATVSFRYSYESDPWPIFMNNNPITLKPGDLAAYRGCEVIHKRNTLVRLDHDWHVQGFFHYVDQNGPFAEFKYDKRESIGHPVQDKKYITYL